MTRPRLIPVAEIEAQTGIKLSKRHAYRLAGQGLLALVKIGRHTYVAADELDRFVASRERPFRSGESPVGAARQAS